MAFAITHFWPGGTQDQYDAQIAAVHPNGGAGLPDGQFFHAAGPVDGGYLIMAVHDSRESWETFRDTILAPLTHGVAGGFTGDPKETDIDLHTLWIAADHK